MKRWIVASAGFVCVLGPGTLYAFSLVSTPLTVAFGWSTSEVAWAFALGNFFFAIGALVGGIFADTYGPRLVATIGTIMWAGGYALCGTLAATQSLPLFYLCYSVIGGAGCGAVYIAALGAAIRWFPMRRGFGSGLVTMGFGLGSFVYASFVKPSLPFQSIARATNSFVEAQDKARAAHHAFDPTPYLMDAETLGQLMAIFFGSAIIFAILGIASALFLSHPRSVDVPHDAPQTSFRTTRMLSDARFYIVWAMLFLNVLGGVTIIANAVPLMHEVTGLTIGEAAGIYGLLAVFNGLGRLVWGAISDLVGSRISFSLLFAGQALAFFALDATTTPLYVAVAVGVLLFCYGGGFGVMPALNASLFGTRYFGVNYGTQLSAFGAAAVFGVYFVSTMKGLSGSFLGLMQPISVIVLVAILFPLIIEAPKRRITSSP